MHINGFTTQATVLRRLSGHPRFRAGPPSVDNTCAPLVASVVRGEACRRSPRWLHWKDIVEPIPPELGWIWRQGNRTNERHRLIQSGSEMPRGPAALNYSAPCTFDVASSKNYLPNNFVMARPSMENYRSRVFSISAAGKRRAHVPLFSDALVERSRQRRGRPKRREATPTARLSPMPPPTETGCNATVRSEPPIRTLAPRPAPKLASPLAPT